jgi:hypothetical protein
MDTSATVTLILVLVLGIGLVVGASYLDKSNREKAENKARATLQAVLDPSEQLIEFTKVNTKGASVATVLLTGWVGAAISRAGGTELYVGLTNRHLVLTPVESTENSRNVQVIPCEDIKGFDVAGGLHGSSTLTTHTRNGDMVMYIPNSQRWIRKASALKNAFANR